VEILVAGEAEESPVAVADRRGAGRWKLVATADEGSARPVLEPPIAITDHGDLEQVAFERRAPARTAVEEADLPLADPGEVAGGRPGRRGGGR
jgi:hypothetical protein